MANEKTTIHQLHVFDDGPTERETPLKTIVMLHGFARNGSFWDGWLPTLLPNYRVVRPDIWGCGRNPDPGPDYVFSLEEVVQDYISLVEGLGVPVNHVGESTGGIVGGLAAARRPDLFESLTLVSTPITTVNSDPKVKSPGAATPEESFQKIGLKQWWLQSRALTNDLFGDERDEWISDEFARTPVHVAVSKWTEMHKPQVSLLSELEKLKLPVLLMTPTQTWTMSMDDQRELAEKLPNCTWKVIEGGTHGMYYLRAKELAEETVKFLDEI